MAILNNKGVITLPPGAWIDWSKLNTDWGAVTPKPLPFTDEYDYACDLGYYPSESSYITDDIRKQRKKEGRCEECGDLLPMSIHGLLECPKHPKQLPPGTVK